MKENHGKRKQNTLKSAKRKKPRHVARTIDILKKVAPDLPVVGKYLWQGGFV